jgi:sugar phosphate isomerase/epimerase
MSTPPGDALSRRAFLGRAVTGAAALGVGALGAAPLLAACASGTTASGAGASATASAGASAGATATASATPAIGVQLYTVRTLMARDMEGTLAELARIGYREVEFAGYYERTPAQVRAMLDRHGLASPSVHVPIEQLRADAAQALDAAQAIGHRWLIAPWLVEAQRTPDGYKRLAADLNRAGEAARARGLRVGYHNHDFEFAALADGQQGYRILLAETDPALVDLELDLFWATKARQDILALFAQHPGRFPFVHVKDMRDLAGAQQMTEVGAGDIDFRRIFAEGRIGGLAHYVVEHDQPADPMASVRTSYANLRRLLA